MPLLLEIVEREYRYLQQLRQAAGYLTIAEDLGVRGPDTFRSKVLQQRLQDLYEYFCHLYAVQPDEDLTQAPAPVRSLPERRRFTRALFEYWTHEGSLEAARHVLDLRTLSDALDLMDDDPRIDLPQRPLAAELPEPVNAFR